MRKKLWLGFTGALITTIPLGTAIACGSNPLTIEVIAQSKGKIDVKKQENEAIVLDVAKPEKFQTSLAAFNTEVSNQLNQRAQTYFLEVADVVHDSALEHIGQLEGLTLLFQSLTNYLHQIATINMSFYVSYTAATPDAVAEVEKLSQTFDLFTKNKWDESIFADVNTENYTSRTNKIKYDILTAESIKLDQYTQIKNSKVMKTYAEQLSDKSKLVIYDFSDLKDKIELDDYKITWATSEAKAKNILKEIDSEIKML